MPRILKDLVIHEVSSVDRGAGEGVRMVLMKRNTQTGDTDMDPKALAELIAKSVAEATTTAIAPILKRQDELERDVKITKMSAAHKAFYDDLKDDKAKKAFEDMDEKGRDAECAKVGKREEPVQHGELETLTKSLTATQAENAELKKRLDARDAADRLVDFNKRAADLGLTEPGDGELMMKAFSGDAASQDAFQKRQAAVITALNKQVETAGLFSTFGKTSPAKAGGAYDQLMDKAQELRKTEKGSELTEAQAFAKVYSDPANAELAAREKQERLQAAN